MAGKIYLVGAGPGDEGLITVKALDKIKEADVILYDRLANDSLLANAKTEAELFYVGKKAANHYRTQAEINQLLISKAEAGKEVVRLKGGDPFVFGRGGEEAEVLAEAGIEFEIIPGITSPISVAAYAGIPLTHRDFSSSLAVVTGHEDPTKEQSSINWSHLAKGVETLVILMGVGNLDKLTDKLIKMGRSPKTPVALVRWGTRPEQETIVGTLADIVGKVREAEFKPPAIIIVGEVVRLREKLNWFEKKALFAKKIVVTRPKEQAQSFCQALAREGAKVIKAPAIEIVAPADDYKELDLSLAKLKDYDWIVFTSVNGVKHFFKRLFALGKDARALGGIKLCAIGPKTAGQLENYGLQADYLPEDYVSESIVAGFENKDLTGQKFLLPRANIARQMLAEELKKLGAEVDNVTAYQTAAADSESLTESLEKGELDLITFTSSSTVENFVKKLGEDYQRLLAGVGIACIGPITAGTARELGLEVDIIADEYTIEGLFEAVKDSLQLTVGS